MTPLETKALEETVKATGNFFSRAFGPAADAFGLIRQDNMNVRRLKNQIAGLKNVRKIVEEEGLTMKQVNLKALFPLLEGIALEEEETLRDMWANLFTNYIDSSKNLLTHVYPEILRQLSTKEVEILKHMCSQNNVILVWDRQALLGTPIKDFAYLDEITNLLRLGIIDEVLRFESPLPKSVIDYNGGPIKPVGPQIKQLSSTHYFITDFGVQFLEACSR